MRRGVVLIACRRDVSIETVVPSCACILRFLFQSLVKLLQSSRRAACAHLVCNVVAIRAGFSVVSRKDPCAQNQA